MPPCDRARTPGDRRSLAARRYRVRADATVMRRRRRGVLDRACPTVLSVLGAEPAHADAELVEWYDWAIDLTDGERPVTRGLHVGFRAPSREAVEAFWQAGIDAGYRDRGAPGPRTIYGPGPPRRLPDRPRRQQRTGGAHGALGPRARRARRPPLDPRPRSRRVHHVASRFAHPGGARSHRGRPRSAQRHFWSDAGKDAHAVEMAREGVPLVGIPRQLGRSDLGITSVYLQGIDRGEIIDPVYARRAPMIPVSVSLRL
jgi:hypothetical protein